MSLIIYMIIHIIHMIIVIKLIIIFKIQVLSYIFFW